MQFALLYVLLEFLSDFLINMKVSGNHVITVEKPDDTEVFTDV